MSFWEDIVDKHRLEMGNEDQPTHHWARHCKEGASTIDMIIVSRPIT
jgi:hypothetical protein